MMKVRFLSTLKKSRSNIERLNDFTRDYSNENSREAAVCRCSSNRCTEKFRNILRETPVLDSLGYLGTATLLKRDSSTGAFQ